jgi:hypothetical protein
VVEVAGHWFNFHFHLGRNMSKTWTFADRRAAGQVLARVLAGRCYQPEVAAAAVVDGGNPEIVRNEDVTRLSGVTQGYLDREPQMGTLIQVGALPGRSRFVR